MMDDDGLYIPLDDGQIGLEPLAERHRERLRGACAAVMKLGATKEGVLRAERITWTGRVRDTGVFSILSHEWAA